MDVFEVKLAGKDANAIFVRYVVHCNKPHPFVHTPGPLPQVRCVSGRHLDLDLTFLIS